MIFPKPFAVDILDSGTVGRSVVRSETQETALDTLGAVGPVFRPSAYGTCGPSATGAQNRAAIQAAIDAAAASGVSSTVLLPGGVLNLDKATSAEPGSPGNDYCLRGASNVTIVGAPTTLRLANNQLVTTPSLRQLAIISLNTFNTGESITDFGLRGITFDGNPQGQGGYSTYDQNGATLAVRAAPGTNTTETIERLAFEDCSFLDFFGNAYVVGLGGGQYVEDFYGNRLLFARCGEGPEHVRVRRPILEYCRYIDDNPTVLLGTGTGYSTVGDCLEFSYCEDGILIGCSVWAGPPTDPLQPWSGGGGSALELFNSVRMQVVAFRSLWSGGIETGYGTGEARDISLTDVRLKNPTPASVSTSTEGIDSCPGMVMTDVVIENFATPLKLLSGPWTLGESASVDFSDLRIKGGGETSQAYILVSSGCKLRGSNLQIEPNEYRDGSLTTRTGNTTGTITLTKSPSGFISTNDTVRVVWCDTTGVRQYRTSVVSVSGSVLTLSGGSGTDLPAAATTVIVDKPLLAADLQKGVRIAYNSDGVHADTRIELTGGRILSTGPAVIVDGVGNSFTPGGFVKDVDARGANGGAWPFTLTNNGLWNGIEVSNVQPKQALLTPGNYAGAELVIAGANVTSLPNGSKNQRLRLQVVPVADPFTPNGTFNFGSTSAATASRLNLAPYLVLQPFENGAIVDLLRDDSLVYNEVARWYPVHQNRPLLLSFEAPITPGAAAYAATPTNYQANFYGRIQFYRARFSNLSAARTAGTIAIAFWKNGSSVATVLNINGTNTTSDTLTMSARLGSPFIAADLLRFVITVSADFTNSGGSTNLILEMGCET